MAVTTLLMTMVAMDEARRRAPKASYKFSQVMGFQEGTCGRHTDERIRLIMALNRHTALTPTRAPTSAPPVVTAPMKYKTNTRSVASFTACTPSSIADGHFRSVRLTPGLSSFWITAAGSKWKKEVSLEQKVVFFDG